MAYGTAPYGCVAYAGTTTLVAPQLGLGAVRVGAPYRSWFVQNGVQDVQQSAISLDYMRVNVACNLPDGTNVDPTDDPVAFAFLPINDVPDADTTWTNGSWDSTGAGFTARILVGPSGQKVLAAGDYSVYVKITDTPEVPILSAGPITIY